jgi:hypothetical protein
MGLPSFYGNPEPEEEAEIFGVPGPEWLTQAPDESTAQREAGHLESEGYDDIQEEIEERAWTEEEPRTGIAAELSRLSDEELSQVSEFIQELLGNNEGQ